LADRVVSTAAAPHTVLLVAVFFNRPDAQLAGAADATSTQLDTDFQPVPVLSFLAYPLSTVGHAEQDAAPAPDHVQFAQVDGAVAPAAHALPAGHFVQLVAVVLA